MEVDDLAETGAITPTRFTSRKEEALKIGAVVKIDEKPYGLILNQVTDHPKVGLFQNKMPEFSANGDHPPVMPQEKSLV